MHPQRALVVAALAAGLYAQSNAVTGLDGHLVQVNNLTYYGRRGTYPTGTVGMAMLNEMCNMGSVLIPWNAAMQPDHPKFGFLVTRVSGGRMVQISDWSYVKHAFLTINVNGTCGTCMNGGSGSAMGQHCDDTYSDGNNSNRYYLGPPEEIDPWLGTWNPVGSYFDRGDPPVAVAQQTDSLRSLTNTQVAAFDAVKNRVTVNEAEITVAGAAYYYGIQLIHQGEPVGNRGDNNASRQTNPTYSSGSGNWSFPNVGSTQVYGSILQWWSGATDTTIGQNGNDDGRVAVGVVVTGPFNGFYHYEYAVHNLDNSRGGAALHIPVCSNARVQNVGFRDIDSNVLNDWSNSRSATELVFSAPAGNPLNWNTIYNFWFDCDAAPAAANVTIDEARVGTGANSFTVATRTPSLLPNVYLGDGCGTTTTTIHGNGIANAGNSSFQIQINGPASTGMFLIYAFGSANVPLAPGCTQFLDNASIGSLGFRTTNASGALNIPLPIPAGFPAADFCLQAAVLHTGGPVFGAFDLSSGLQVRINPVGCQ